MLRAPNSKVSLQVLRGFRTARKKLKWTCARNWPIKFKDLGFRPAVTLQKKSVMKLFNLVTPTALSQNHKSINAVLTFELVNEIPRRSI